MNYLSNILLRNLGLNKGATATEERNFNLRGPLLTYREMGYKLSYMGVEDVDYVACYKLKLNFGKNRVKYFYLDTSTYYIIREEEPSEKGTPAFIDYRDYKMLPYGIVYPMTKTHKMGTEYITDIQINTPVDTGMFHPDRHH